MRSVMIITTVVASIIAGPALSACDSGSDRPQLAATGATAPAGAAAPPSATSLPVLESEGDGVVCQRYDRARTAAQRVLAEPGNDEAAGQQLEAARVALAAAAVSATDPSLYADVRRAAQALSGIVVEQGTADELAVRAFDIVSKRVTDRCSVRKTF